MHSYYKAILHMSLVSVLKYLIRTQIPAQHELQYCTVAITMKLHYFYYVHFNIHVHIYVTRQFYPSDRYTNWFTNNNLLYFTEA